MRPTSVLRTPDELRGHLTQDQFRLYELVWKRTVACQMTHATTNTVVLSSVLILVFDFIMTSFLT